MMFGTYFRQLSGKNTAKLVVVATLTLGMLAGCSDSSSSRDACFYCHGKGKVTCISCNGYGTIGVRMEDPVCRGTGYQICPNCNGSGKESRKRYRG
jgi:DnaJ-class molecular chaperone